MLHPLLKRKRATTTAATRRRKVADRRAPHPKEANPLQQLQPQPPAPTRKVKAKVAKEPAKETNTS